MRSRNNEEAVSPVIGVILMVAITVILAAVIAAFVFGMSPPPKAPTVQLRITAINTSVDDNGNGTLKLTHNGGDGLILANEKITVTNAVNDNTIGIDGVTLVDFQVPALNITTLGAGASLTHTWGTSPDKAPAKGTILKVMLQDIPSGQVITQMQVTVT